MSAKETKKKTNERRAENDVTTRREKMWNFTDDAVR